MVLFMKKTTIMDLNGKLNKLGEYFKKNKNIIGIIIFGSYGSIYYSDNSDIDFGVVYKIKPNLFMELGVEDSISKILGTDNIDVVNLNNAPLIFRYNALSKGRVIYEEDSQILSDFFERTYLEFCDYKYDYVVSCSDYDDSLKENYVNG